MHSTTRKLQLLFGSLVPLAAMGLGAKQEAAAEPISATAEDKFPTFRHSFCVEDGHFHRALQGLKLAPPLPDYLALMELRTGPRVRPSDEGEVQAVLLTEAGWQCAHASDVARCKAEMANPLVAPAAHTVPDSLLPQYLVVQRADEQRVVASSSELQTLLGAVDTLAESALIATLKGYRVQCGFSTGERRGTSFRLTAETGNICEENRRGHVLEVTREGQLSVVSTGRRATAPHCGAGRSPNGIRISTYRPQSAAEYFAMLMGLEHASVAAFEHIGTFLQRHGAPRGLVRRARRAAQDERRHTDAMRRLTRRFRGEIPNLPAVVPEPFEDLFAFAVDNAEEGCVREMFAALLLWEQASIASDPVVARELHRIARDETLHAALAWDLAAWVEPMLSEPQRAYVASRRARAFAELRAQCAEPWDLSLASHIGMPSSVRALQLVDALQEGAQGLAA